MLLTDKYADKIHGIITCYDRMIIQGYIPNWSHAEAMTAYMKLNGIRIFDYPTSFSQPLTEQIRQHLPKITPSAMTRIFKRLKVHGLIEKIPGSYKYLITALGKEIIAAGLSIKNLILVPALRLDFPDAEILPFCVENHL